MVVEIKVALIILISISFQKNKKLKVPGDFRPIVLCNVIFKIITKTIVNRLKLIHPYIIGKFQSSIVIEPLITDSVLLAFESLHYMMEKIKIKVRRDALA